MEKFLPFTHIKGTLHADSKSTIYSCMCLQNKKDVFIFKATYRCCSNETDKDTRLLMGTVCYVQIIQAM